MFKHRLNDRVEIRLYEERFAEEVFRVTDANRALGDLRDGHVQGAAVLT